MVCTLVCLRHETTKPPCKCFVSSLFFVTCVNSMIIFDNVTGIKINHETYGTEGSCYGPSYRHPSRSYGNESDHSSPCASVSSFEVKQTFAYIADDSLFSFDHRQYSIPFIYLFWCFVYFCAFFCLLVFVAVETSFERRKSLVTYILEGK